MTRALTSIASTRKRSPGTPASSSAIAIEYGSSPVEDGRLSRRSMAAPGGRQPCLPADAGERREGFAVAEEPGLGHDDRFDQRLQLGRRTRVHTPSRPAGPAGHMPRARSCTARSMADAPIDAASSPMDAFKQVLEVGEGHQRPRRRREQHVAHRGGSRLSDVDPLDQASRVGGHRPQIRRAIVGDAGCDEVRRIAPHGLGGLLGDEAEQMRCRRGASR